MFQQVGFEKTRDAVESQILADSAMDCERNVQPLAEARYRSTLWHGLSESS
jgi:hypothetical protein